MRVKMEKILCATDFSTYSNHALPYGIALAREFAARLLICHVIDVSFIGLYDTTAFALQKTEQELMNYAGEEIRQLIGFQAVEWEPLVLEGSPSDQIARTARRRDVDLVITATHGRSGLTRLLLGSVTERLLRTLTCPLLVVRSPEHEFVAPAGDQIELRRILVGCDFSPDSMLALDYACRLAQEFEAELHLVHVLEPSVYKNLTKRTASLANELQGALREGLQHRLSELVPPEEYPWCELTTHLSVGRPHEQLIAYAGDHGIDLIVLGTRGHSLVEKLFIGSTTDRVLRQCPCPVLSVPQAVAAGSH